MARVKEIQKEEREIVYSHQYSEELLVTPELAQIFLDHQARNRKPNYSRIAAYALEMREGRWINRSPEPVIISKYGQMLDGQHRMLAVIASGVPQLFWVTYGADEEVMAVLDSGLSRSTDQTGSILGLNIDRLSVAITKWLFIPPWATSIPRQIDNQLIFKVFSEFEEGIQFSLNRRSTQPIFLAAVRAVIARAYYHTADRQRLLEFIAVLDTGFGESDEDSAAIALRNYCTSNIRQNTEYKLSAMRLTYTAVDSFLRRAPNRKLKPTLEQIYPLSIDK